MTPIYSATFICSFLFFYKTLHINHFIASKFKDFSHTLLKMLLLREYLHSLLILTEIFLANVLLSDILFQQMNQSIKCHPPWKQIYKEKRGIIFSYSGRQPWQCNNTAIVSALTL